MARLQRSLRMDFPSAIHQLLMSNAQHIPMDMQRNALQKVLKGSKNKQVKRQANRLLKELK
jgi:Holliday junction resolvasome RuvABC ATP-dependent DNA helicase subunit